MEYDRVKLCFIKRTCFNSRLTAFVFCMDGWTDQWMKQLAMRRLTIRYAVAQEI